jgi:hypothetical protein
VDLRSKNQDQLLEIGNKSLERLEDFETRITSLEGDRARLVSLFLSLTKITSGLRNRLFELSRDNKALTQSLETHAPEVYARFSDLRNDSRTHPTLVDVPSVQELEQAIEAFLGEIR